MTKKEGASCVSFIRYLRPLGDRLADYGRCEKIDEKNIRVKERYVCKKYKEIK